MTSENDSTFYIPDEDGLTPVEKKRQELIYFSLDAAGNPARMKALRNISNFYEVCFFVQRTADATVKLPMNGLEGDRKERLRNDLKLLKE